MDKFEIFIAYVSWGSGGKKRPILVLSSDGTKGNRHANGCYTRAVK